MGRMIDASWSLVSVSTAPVGSSPSTTDGSLTRVPRDGHALLFPTRELVRPVVHAVREADLAEHCAGPLAVPFRLPCVVQGHGGLRKVTPAAALALTNVRGPRTYLVPVPSPIAACAAARRATGTRNGLHDT